MVKKIDYELLVPYEDKYYNLLDNTIMNVLYQI